MIRLEWQLGGFFVYANTAVEKQVICVEDNRVHVGRVRCLGQVSPLEVLDVEAVEHGRQDRRLH